MTAERLAGIAGVGLTLLFSYVPGLDVWYERQSGQVKSLIMLGLLLVFALGIFGLSCYSPYQYVPCTTAGAWALAKIFAIAAVLNATSYLLTNKIRSQRFQRLTDEMWQLANIDPNADGGSA